MQTKDRYGSIKVKPFEELYPFGLLAVPFTLLNKDKPCKVQEKTEKRSPKQ